MNPHHSAQASEAQSQARPPGVVQDFSPTLVAEWCAFCGHDRHDGAFCKGRAECDCGRRHPCACSFPDPSNYAEVPE